MPMVWREAQEQKVALETARKRRDLAMETDWRHGQISEWVTQNRLGRSERGSSPNPLSMHGLKNNRHRRLTAVSMSPAVTYLRLSYSATIAIVEHTLQLFLQVVDFSQILEMKDGGGRNRGSEFADARLRWFHQLFLRHCWWSQVRNGAETWVEE